MSQDNQDQVQAQDETQRDQQEEEQQPEPWDWHFFDPSRPEFKERKFRARYHWQVFKDTFEKLKPCVNSENYSDLMDIDVAITLLQNAYYDFKSKMTNPIVETDGTFDESRLHIQIGETVYSLKKSRSSVYIILDSIRLLLPQEWCWLFDAKRKFVDDTIDGTFSALKVMRNLSRQESLSIKQTFNIQKTINLFQFARNYLHFQRMSFYNQELVAIHANFNNVSYTVSLRRYHIVHIGLLIEMCGWLRDNFYAFRGNANKILKDVLDRVMRDIKANLCWDDMRTIKTKYNLDMEMLFINLETFLIQDWNRMAYHRKEAIVQRLDQTMFALKAIREMCLNGELAILQALDMEPLKKLFDWAVRGLGIEGMKRQRAEFYTTVGASQLNPDAKPFTPGASQLNPDAKPFTPASQSIKPPVLSKEERFKVIQDLHIELLYGLCEWIKSAFNDADRHVQIKKTLHKVFQHMKAKLTWKDIKDLRINNDIDMFEVYDNLENLLLLDRTHCNKKVFAIELLREIVHRITGMYRMKDRNKLKKEHGLDIGELLDKCQQLKPLIYSNEWSEYMKIRAQRSLTYIDNHILDALQRDHKGILKKRLFFRGAERIEKQKQFVEKMETHLQDDSLLQNYKFLGDLTAELKNFEGTRYEHPDSSGLVSREDQESSIPKKWCEFCRYVWRYEKVHTNGSVGSKIAISHWGKPSPLPPVINSPFEFQPGADLTPRVTPSGMPAKYARLSQPTATRPTAVSETQDDHGENDDPDHSPDHGENDDPDHSSPSMDLSNADSDDSSSGVFSSSSDLSESLSTSLSASMPSSPELPKPETSQIVERFTTAGEQYRKMLADVGRIEENEPEVATGEASTPGDVDIIEEVLTGEASTLRDAGRMAEKKPAGDASDRSSTTVSETKSKHQMKQEKKKRKKEKRKTKSKKGSSE